MGGLTKEGNPGLVPMGEAALMIAKRAIKDGSTLALLLTQPGPCELDVHVTM